MRSGLTDCWISSSFIPLPDSNLALKLDVMLSKVSQLDDTPLPAALFQRTDPETLGDLRDQCHTSLLAILIARGASPTEAEDLVADLWTDCVPGPERPSLLEKFSGRCSLQGWLATVATNRWVDFKRKQARLTETPTEPGSSDLGTGAGALTRETFQVQPQSGPEDVLLALLRDSLQAAFGRCAPQALVLLRMVYLHGVSQRELVQMLDWSETKVSRFLSQAMKDIEEQTLSALKARDPWLQLTWQDFVDLCETHQIGFV
jgi:RNA polymerase sigma factor (sigma-70 family)